MDTETVLQQVGWLYEAVAEKCQELIHVDGMWAHPTTGIALANHALGAEYAKMLWEDAGLAFMMEGVTIMPVKEMEVLAVAILGGDGSQHVIRIGEDLEINL